MGSSVSLSGGQQDLSHIAHVTNVTDIQSLRIQKPALVWVYMQTCHWSQVSAQPISDFASLDVLPVYGIDGVQHAQQLYNAGFRPNGFPTVYLLKANKKATEFKSNISKESLEKFVRSELK